MNGFFEQFRDKKIWTISINKIPIDAVALFKNNPPKKGYAYEYNNNCLVTYDTIPNLKPKPKYTMFHDVLETFYLLIDIENNITKENLEYLKRLPYEYLEYSTSKTGYHMYIPITAKMLKKFPLLTQKSMIKSKDRSYEFLLKHYTIVTFDEIKENHTPNLNLDEFLTIFFKEKGDMSETKTKINYNLPITNNARLLRIAVLQKYNYKKTPNDFPKKDDQPDMSSYELSMANYVYNKVDWYAREYYKDKPSITKDDKIVATHMILKEKLEPREKHNRIIDGLPWLYHLINLAVNVNEKRKKS